MKKIALTNGGFALVDDIDFEYLNQWKWQAHKSKFTFYVRRSERYGSRTENKSKKYYMHRVILELSPNEICDHKDRNGLNNQRDNLRKATYSQNNTNRKLKTGKKLSDYKGVYKVKNRFKASIGINGKTVHIGSFIKENDAVLAYNNKAIETYGEFANINQA